MRYWQSLGFACIAAMSVAGGARAQSVGATMKLAPLAGHYYTPASGQTNIGFYGTDLGWAFQHGPSQLRLLYGDSWADTFATPIGPAGSSSDDTQGVIDLNLFPDGDTAEGYAFLHPYDDFLWHRQGPPVTFPTSFGKIAPMVVRQGDANGTILKMGLGRTPQTGFSTGPEPNGAVFALFNRNVFTTCGSDSECSNSSDGVGFTCDKEMGTCCGMSWPDPCPSYSHEDAVPCRVYSDGSNTCKYYNFNADAKCIRQPSAGFCIDPSTYAGLPDSLEKNMMSVVEKQPVGNADRNQPNQFLTKIWRTNKFLGTVARTVRSYDPANSTHDYNPIVSAPGTSAKVFLWGRPGGPGAKSQHRSIPLYFAYVALPNYDASGNISWAPKYFKGMSGNVPLYSSNQKDAANILPSDPLDISTNVSISYIDQLKKWVMLYGGDMHHFLILRIGGVNSPFVQRNPGWAIHARFADNPWGPWTPPAQVFGPGTNPQGPTVPSGTEYGQGGSMHHWLCSPGSACVAGEQALLYFATNYGFLYAPSIIDPWTEARGADAADIYWTVTTWDPYMTLLLKTRINRF